MDALTAGFNAQAVQFQAVQTQMKLNYDHQKEENEAMKNQLADFLINFGSFLKHDQHINAIGAISSSRYSLIPILPMLLLPMQLLIKLVPRVRHHKLLNPMKPRPSTL